MYLWYIKYRLLTTLYIPLAMQNRSIAMHQDAESSIQLYVYHFDQCNKAAQSLLQDKYRPILLASVQLSIRSILSLSLVS